MRTAGVRCNRFERIVVVNQQDFIPGGTREEAGDIVCLPEGWFILDVRDPRFVAIRCIDQVLRAGIAGIVANEYFDVCVRLSKTRCERFHQQIGSVARWHANRDFGLSHDVFTVG
jgi:hypothetical protein